MKVFVASTWILSILTFSSAVYATPSFSIIQFVNLIDANKVHDIEGALAILPDDLKSNYTLQYKGHGLQGASFENPRVILFGLDAKFIIAFNGSKEQALNSSLEIMQFNESKSEFELYSLDFPLVKNSSGRTILPSKNLKTCTACHGESPRPIWSEYNTWPGVYGSMDDDLSQANDELQQFQNFTSKASHHSRYKHLIPMPGSDFSPFRIPGDEGKKYLQHRPNTRLGLALNRLNAIRMQKKMRQSQNYELYNLLFFSTKFNCLENSRPGWTANDQRRLDQIFIPKIQINHNGSIPFPDVPAQSNRNLAYLFNPRFSFAMNFNFNNPSDLSYANYFDGAIYNDGAIPGVLKSDLLKMIPSAEVMFHPFKLFQYSDASDHSSASNFDRKFLQTEDDIFIGENMYLNRADEKYPFCDYLLAQLHKLILRD